MFSSELGIAPHPQIFTLLIRNRQTSITISITHDRNHYSISHYVPEWILNTLRVSTSRLAPATTSHHYPDTAPLTRRRRSMHRHSSMRRRRWHRVRCRLLFGVFLRLGLDANFRRVKGIFPENISSLELAYFPEISLEFPWKCIMRWRRRRRQRRRRLRRLANEALLFGNSLPTHIIPS